jgi:hypothetical protein
MAPMADLWVVAAGFWPLQGSLGSVSPKTLRCLIHTLGQSL